MQKWLSNMLPEILLGLGGIGLGTAKPATTMIADAMIKNPPKNKFVRGAVLAIPAVSTAGLLSAGFITTAVEENRKKKLMESAYERGYNNAIGKISEE